MKKLILSLIKFYQKHLSIKRWVVCRYIPTCSEYTHQAVEKYGAFKGSFLGLKRVLRCHPWSRGGEDLLE